MIDFQKLTATRVTQPISESLSKLVKAQSVLWTSKEDPWVVIPIDEDSFEVIATTNESMRRSLEALRSALGPSESPVLSDYVKIEVEGLGIMVARLRPLPGKKNRVVAALDLLGKTRKAQPLPMIQKEEVLNSLLRDFFLSLSNQDRALAEVILIKIKKNGRLRLDNQVFLRLQKEANFGQWLEITGRPEFVDLCKMRKPNRISAILLEALFHSLIDDKLKEVVPEEFLAKISKNNFSSHVVDLVNGISFPDRPLARRMLAVYLKSANKTERLDTLLSAVITEEREELRRWVGDSSVTEIKKTVVDQPTYGQDVETKNKPHDYIATVESALNNPETFPLRANEVLMALLEMDDLNLIVRFKESFETSKAIEDLNVGQKLLWTIICSRAGSSCTGWPEWAERMSRTFWEEGRTAISDWRTWSTSWITNRAVAEKFANDLLESSLNENRPILEIVIADLIDFLIVIADESGVEALEPMRSALILIVTDLAPSSSAMREGAVLLLGSTISNGCSIIIYRELLEMIEKIWIRHCSPRTINWIAVVLAEVDDSPCPDISLREGLKIQVALSLAPHLNSISDIWRLELTRSLGSYLPSPVALISDRASDWRFLANKKIGIYSMLPTVASLVNELSNLGVDVRWRDDAVANRNLKDAFQQVDVLFVHTARASHMGTATFGRLDAEMRYVNLRSLTAMRRAIDVYAQELELRPL